MNAYIVMDGEDKNFISGVFETKEKAQEFVDRSQDNHNMQISEHIFHDKDFKLVDYPFLEINFITEGKDNKLISFVGIHHSNNVEISKREDFKQQINFLSFRGMIDFFRVLIPIYSDNYNENDIINRGKKDCRWITNLVERYFNDHKQNEDVDEQIEKLISTKIAPSL